MDIRTISSLSKIQADCRFVGCWPNKDGTIPIYHTYTSHAFNRVVGYAMLINASAGTVLYRGQNKLYNSLKPSGARDGKSAIPEKLFDKICSDTELLKFFNLTQNDIAGWKQYRSVIIESVLQHYGAHTYCMDFVDNHWCALWFGLYQFKNNHYHKRTDNGNLYVFLYAADTIGPCVKGMYIGSDTYTVDLRKALPSTFQRPASQHGWIVRKKYRNSDSLDDRLIGIIEVSVCDAEKWLGDGSLLSEENFFPPFSIDQGYKVLLSRQIRSGIDLKRPKVLPQKTICNYHLSDMFYVSAPEDLPKPKRKIPFINTTDEDLITTLFHVLLNFGWQKDSCCSEALWDENQPYSGQSAPTAILVQKYFGGDICMMQYGQRPHYYNMINGTILDLTSSELQAKNNADYYDPSRYTNLGSRKNRSVHNRNKENVRNLIFNCQNNNI